MRRYLGWIALLFLTLTGYAADWYVDSAATGSANGTSWANAWTTPASITWGSVSSGDTIWFDGGSTSKSYPGFNIQKSGIGSGKVTIRCSQDSGRNGMVKFTYGISTYGNTNIMINGAKDDAFPIPSSVTDLYSLTNNMGIMWDDPSTEAITANNSRNCTFKWLWIRRPGAFSTGNDGVNGIVGANTTAGQAYQNLEIAYCYIHEGSQDAINFQSAAATAFDQATVHHCLLIDNVDDGIQFGGAGLTAHHNLIGGRYLSWTNGHPDCIQVSGSDHLRVYNNILYNAWNSFVYNEIGTTEGASKGDLYIYGNLCYNQPSWDVSQQANYSLYLQHWTDQHGGENPDGPFTQTILTNVYIVNNTLVHCKQNVIRLTQTRQSPTFTRTMAQFTMPAEGATVNVTVGNTNWVDLNELMYVNNVGVFKLISIPNATTFELQNLEDSGLGLYPGNTAPGVPISTNERFIYVFRGIHDVIATNVVVKNNLVYDGGYSGGSPVAIQGPSITDYYNSDPTIKEGFHYTTNEVIVSKNVTAGSNKGTEYMGSNYVNAASFNAAWPFTHYDTSPSFTSTNDSDFTLTSEDTTAKDRGDDLTSLTNKLTGLGTDLYGNHRGSDGLWDIGANEFTSPGLVLMYNFQTAFTSGTISDVSGLGNDGLRRGRCGQTTNWPVAVTVTNGYTESTGGSFNYYYDSYGTYGRSGDYIAVTNLNGGTSLANFTVMLWAKYGQATDAGGLPASWTTDHNATLIDNGQYLTAGSWRLGRENFWSGASYNNQTKWTVFNGATESQRLQLSFFDEGDAYGETSEMKHYAVTFDSGTSRLYLNGVEVTNKTHAQTTLKLDTTTHWLGIGGWPHHGSTSRDSWLTSDLCPSYDEYPNTFWFKGEMDNVRIYTNTLTGSQVLAIYNAERGYAAPPPVSQANVTYASLGMIVPAGWTPPVPPLMQEGFEGTGYENSWTESGNCNEDSEANVVEGLQSLVQTTSSSVAYCYYVHGTAVDEAWLYAAFRMSSLSSARTIMALRDTSGNTVAYCQISSSAVYVGASGGLLNNANYSSSADSWYYGWLHYKKSSGATDGACDFSIAATTAKPASPTVSLAAHNITTQIKQVLLGTTSSTTVNRTYDNVVFDDAVIGSNP